MGSKLLQLVALLSLVGLMSAISCSSNQYYAFDGSCVNCPENCSTCSNAQFCTACLSNFYLVSNNYNVTCQTCSQIFVGCATCLSNVACTKCISGYFISNAVCTPCSSKIIFCNSCSNDGKTCIDCSYPFILVNNLCVSQVISAVSGGNTGALPNNSQASTGNSSSRPNVTLITLANGTKVVPVLDGNGCNQIQIYYQGRCIKKIDFCSIYQPSGLCQFCMPSYLVTIYGDCTPNNRVLACEDGYWHNVKADSCVPVSPACDWYYPNNGSCLNCSKGYTMVNGSCVQSLVCNSRQFFDSGVCVDVPASCATFSPIDGACTACVSGYNLGGGICTKTQRNVVAGNGCTFPCNTCVQSRPGFCFSCVIHYQLRGGQYGTCVPVPN